MFAGSDSWLLQCHYQLVCEPLVCSGWLQVHLESVLKSELVQNGNTHALKHITPPPFGCRMKSQDITSFYGSIEAPGNESSSKLSVLITLRTAAMESTGVLGLGLFTGLSDLNYNHTNQYFKLLIGLCAMWDIADTIALLSNPHLYSANSQLLLGESSKTDEVYWSQMAYGLTPDRAHWSPINIPRLCRADWRFQTLKQKHSKCYKSSFHFCYTVPNNHGYWTNNNVTVTVTYPWNPVFESPTSITGTS